MIASRPPLPLGVARGPPAAASGTRLKALVPIEGAPPSLLAPPPGCPFHPRCPYRFEPCDHIVPPLVAPDGGHLDACHLPFERKVELGRERADRRLGTAAA